MMLGDKPSVFHVVNRAKQISLIDNVWLATTVSSKDDSLASWAKEAGINFFRGSEEDVLDRYYQTAKKAKADVVVRITGDCPLLDPKISDKVIERYLKGDVDYVTNTKPPTYPDGMDTEAFSFKVLEKVWKEAKLKSEREHVTPYIWKNPKIFKISNVSETQDISGLRLTLDTKEDFEFLEKIIGACEKKGRVCDMADIDELLKQNPEWKLINSKYKRDEGYAKSVKEEGSI